MKIALIGSSGLVGSALREYFLKGGHEIVIFKRNKEGSYLFRQEDFDGVQAVINLAGESISERWTDEQKKKIYDSRVNTTKALSDILKQLKEPPRIVINASAIGYYGFGKERMLDETSGPGHDFLASVANDWEKALQVPKTRTVLARFGVILSAKGGALSKMLFPFKACLGGRLGTGKQYMSWIDLDDVVLGINYIIHNETIEGPVNFVSPNPIRNEEFTKVLGTVLHRPTIFPVPAGIIKLIFGEMGESLLLSSIRVLPKVLLESGYLFQYPHLKEALQHELS